ncbi:hypothetical protein [Micrococcoides hystricis]|uniref:DUF2029 domain-containing protein n=1 Tax=Micrococcoides hystricis TaxID=1572761 RepID=A0ABV6PA02_9MICC
MIGGLLFPKASYEFWTSHVFSLSDKVDLGTNFASSGNNSIAGMMAYFWPEAPSTIIIALLGAAGAGILLLARKLWYRDSHIEAVLVVGAGIQLLSPVSWIHHWVFLVFAVVYLLFRGVTRSWGIAALVFLWLQPTDLGEWLLESAHGSVFVVVAGTLLREGLLLLTILCQSVIFWSAFRRGSAPIEGAEPVPDCQDAGEGRTCVGVSKQEANKNSL